MIEVIIGTIIFIYVGQVTLVYIEFFSKNQTRKDFAKSLIPFFMPFIKAYKAYERLGKNDR